MDFKDHASKIVIGNFFSLVRRLFFFLLFFSVTMNEDKACQNDDVQKLRAPTWPGRTADSSY